MTIPLLYQLQDTTYQSLASADYRVGVIDPDYSGLSAAQIAELQDEQGKKFYGYTSIGEAEDYRDYWDENNWDASPPDFLLEENANWAGNYRVKFWDEDWQDIIMQRVKDVVDLGYNGIYLDIVDGYTVGEVKDAYPGTDDELRQEMIDFVISISDYAKSLNPDFEVIPQNAVGLLANDENNPNSGPNTAYLDAVDGLGIEDLWYNDNSISSWTDGDLSYIQIAQDAGKFVLATSYPTDDAKQADFIANALEEGLIPFAADRDLSGVMDNVNNGTDALIEAGDYIVPWGDTETSEPTEEPTETPEEPTGPTEEPTETPEGPVNPETSLMAQTDTVTVSQANADQWTTVTFDEAIEGAVVIMGPVSANGSQPTIAKVRNVTDEGFEFQIDEWDYTDGFHLPVEVSWMAASAGDYTLDDGRKVSFGSTTAEDNLATDVDLSGFDTKPVVITQIGSDNDTSDAVTTRVSDVTEEGFRVRMQEQESADQEHASETVYWMAVEEGEGDLSATIIDEGVDHEWTDTGLDAAENMFAAMQTADGKNTATLRYDVEDDGSVAMRVQEETSLDAETWHVEEEIGAVFVDGDGFALNIA